MTTTKAAGKKEKRKERTPEFRVSFPHVFKPTKSAEADADAKEKYSITMMFPKNTDLSKLKALARAAIAEKWGDKPPKNLRTPFRDGNEKADEGYEEYRNMIFCNATSMQKPGLVDENVDPIINESDFYAGCWARATLTAYAYDRKGNKGVAFGLQNIQKVRDDEAFSGRGRAEDDFDPVNGGSKSDDDDDDGGNLGL